MPAWVEPKSNRCGATNDSVNATFAGRAPCPVSVAMANPLALLTWSFAPASVNELVGANWTVTVQTAAVASGVVQVFAVIAIPVALVNVALVMVTGLTLLFVTVTSVVGLAP